MQLCKETIGDLVQRGTERLCVGHRTRRLNEVLTGRPIFRGESYSLFYDKELTPQISVDGLKKLCDAVEIVERGRCTI